MGQSYLELPPTLKHGHTLVVNFNSANILTTYYASLAMAQQPEVRLPQRYCWKVESLWTAEEWEEQG